MIKKYPRTPHLPWSEGASKDDRIIKDVKFLCNKKLIITEKLDGSNICLQTEAVFARSHSGPPKHVSFDWLKRFHASIGYKIPKGLQIFCEYTFAVHSIQYTRIPSQLWVIGVRKDGYWRDWSETQRVARILEIPTVPVLGSATLDSLEKLKIFTEHYFTIPGEFGEKEGIVVRNADGFPDTAFPNNIAKMVRKNHVQTDIHWTNQPMVIQNTY